MVIRVDYLHDGAAAEAVLAARGCLGVVQFGGAPAAHSPGIIQVALEPAGGAPVFEAWQIDDRAAPLQVGEAMGRVSDAYAFAAVAIADEDGLLLDDSVEQAYRDLFLFLRQAGDFQPIRFWNYISRITDLQDGVERYWRFNSGRERAFAAALRQALPPVATGIGCVGRRSVIYLLAAHRAATPVENPRQISAYAYPERYGPARPRFSRASRHEGGALFISGTASIVGHESRHPGDFAAQMGETLTNLGLMMRLAEEGSAGAGPWLLKTYLRDLAHAPALDRALAELLPPGARTLHLAAEICRRDLLVEIEALRCAV